jgi:hypothetical protein
MIPLIHPPLVHAFATMPAGRGRFRSGFEIGACWGR